MPGSHRDDQLAIALGDRIWQHDQTAVWLAGKTVDSTFDFNGVAHLGPRQPHPEGWCRSFDRLPHPRLRFLLRIQHDGHTGYVWRSLLQYLQRLPVHRKLGRSEACDVRMRQTCDKAAAHRIDNPCEYNWYVARQLLQRLQDQCGADEKHVWFQTQKLLCIDPYARGIGTPPSDSRSARCRQPIPVFQAPAGMQLYCP